jgi:hypothetical protein
VIGFMGGRFFLRPHFMEGHFGSRVGRLPSGLRSGQAASDNDEVCSHDRVRVVMEKVAEKVLKKEF